VEGAAGLSCLGGSTLAFRPNDDSAAVRAQLVAASNSASASKRQSGSADLWRLVGSSGDERVRLTRATPAEDRISSHMLSGRGARTGGPARYPSQRVVVPATELAKPRQGERKGWAG
jgi:hypothetical protein